MDRTNKIKQVLKLCELANSEYQLGNNKAGRAAMAKAVELMDSHHITRAELAQAELAQTANPAPGNAAAAHAAPRRAGHQTSGKVKAQNVEITWGKGVVTVNGKTVRNEREVVEVAAHELMQDFLNSLFNR